MAGCRLIATFFGRQEVLEQFAEAQGGRKVGARPMDEIEGTTIGDRINLPVSGQRGSAVLGAALRPAGIMRPGTDYHAHHIVPRGMNGAQRAREILERAGIGINSAANGVWLGSNSVHSRCRRLAYPPGHPLPAVGYHITRVLAGAEADGGSRAVKSAMVRLRNREPRRDERRASAEQAVIQRARAEAVFNCFRSA